MKQFHWATVPAADIGQSVWKEVSDDDVNLDIKELEEKFSAPSLTKKTAAVGDNPQAALAAAMMAKSNKPSVVELIDSKRSYQVNIALARFKMTHAAVRDALLAMDSSALDEEKLLSLSKIAPLPEEIEAVRDFDGEGELGQTEQFFRAISEVPRVGARIDLFLFKLRFDAMIDEITNQLTLCESMIHTLRNSKNLHQLMALILKLGNYLNGGTAKGGAWGFKLDTINKLKNTKSQDNLYTLLHYIILLVQSNTQYTPVLAFLQDLDPLHSASRIEMSVLQSEVNKVKATNTKLKTELSAVPKTDTDRFSSIMNEFQSVLNTQSQSLTQRMSQLENDVSATIKFYCEDPSSMTMESLFKAFMQFRDDFADGIQYIENRKLAAEKEAKMKQEKEKREREKMGREIGRKSGGNVDKDALVDSVMEQLSCSTSEDMMRAIKARRKMVAEEDDDIGDPRKLNVASKQGLIGAVLARQSGGKVR